MKFHYYIIALLWIVLLQSTNLNAKTINVTTAGTLGVLIPNSDRLLQYNLTITGQINAKDFKLIRDSLLNLSYLDISSVTIVQYSGTDGTASNLNVSYPPNELPKSSFNISSLSRAPFSWITLPQSITSIGDSALKNCDKMNGQLFIPNKVTSIGAYAFFGCSGLSHGLFIPLSVKKIGTSAFIKTGFNGPLVISDSITDIGSKAFSGCKFNKVIMGKSIINIGDSAFSDCNELKETITLPKSIKKIGKNAFMNCSKVSRLIIESDNVPNIYSETFGNLFPTSTCILIVKEGTKTAYEKDPYWNKFVIIKEMVKKNINLDSPGTLNSIISASEKSIIYDLTISGSLDARDIKLLRDSFSILSNLDISNTDIIEYIGVNGTGGNTTITYPKDEMPKRSFYLTNRIPAIRQIKMPHSLKSIGESAFKDCQLAGSLSIPNNVTKISGNAFWYCVLLTDELIIPNSVVGIGEYAFAGCWGIKSITFSNQIKIIDDGAFADCKGFSSLFQLPDSLQYIGIGTFTTNFNISSDIVVPFNTKFIDYEAFYQSGKTNKVITKAITPPQLGLNAFDDQENLKNYVLVVPKGTKQLYSTATNWRYFGTIIEDFDIVTNQNVNLESQLEIYTSPIGIVVKNSSEGELINVYNINGFLIKSSKSDGISTIIPIENKGTYIVKVGNQSKKILVL